MKKMGQKEIEKIAKESENTTMAICKLTEWAVNFMVDKGCSPDWIKDNPMAISALAVNFTNLGYALCEKETILSVAKKLDSMKKGTK